MSNKHANSPHNTGLVSVLYRMDDVPLIPINTADMSNIVNELSFYDYFCPFNTTFPLCEFDKTDEIITHLDKRVGADLNQNEVLASPPRQIQAQDILLTTYRNPARRTCFFLLPRFDPATFKKVAQTCQKTEGITLFNRPVASRFHAVTIKHPVKGYDTIPDLIDTNHRPDDR